MASEEDRTRLIGEIASLIRDARVPDEARCAALTLIGWLARRMPGECAHDAGVDEMKRREAAGVHVCCEHAFKVVVSGRRRPPSRRPMGSP